MPDDCPIPVIQTRVPETERTGLVRAIGRWSLAALVVNSIIGSGIFALPADVARLIGAASPWAVLVAGAAAGVIMACFAEVASQFSEAGGPYLYTRAAFGRLVGIEMGWMLWLVRVAAPAATANLFVIYCGEFWPDAAKPLPRFLILTFLYGILTLINYRGVRASTQVSNVFTVAKLGASVSGRHRRHVLSARGHKATALLITRRGARHWQKAALLLVFAYGGFETALTPLSEAKNPRRDAVFALVHRPDHVHGALHGHPVGGDWRLAGSRHTASVLWRTWRGWHLATAERYS